MGRNIKHIVIVADNYPTEYDPVFPFVAQLAEAIAKNGVDVTVIAPQSIAKWVKTLKSKHPFKRTLYFGENKLTILQPLCISFSNKTPRLNAWSRKFAIGKCFERLKNKPDVCYGHFWHSGYFLYDKAKKYNLPLFVATGESIIRFNAKTKNEKDFCEYVKGVICVSTKNKDESIEKKLTVEKKCIIIPNAIDNNVFKQLDKGQCRSVLNINDNDFVVAFVGWFGERKGSLRVSNAIQKLNNPHIKSIFIGTGSVNFEPTCDNIIFKGRLAHHEVPHYLNAADVFVLPTLHEGCCNAIIEAMACGLPIISSDLSFNHDVLNDTNSIMIDPNDESAISDAICKLYNDKIMRKNLSDGALCTSLNLTIEKRSSSILRFMELCTIKNN